MISTITCHDYINHDISLWKPTYENNITPFYVHRVGKLTKTHSQYNKITVQIVTSDTLIQYIVNVHKSITHSLYTLVDHN